MISQDELRSRYDAATPEVRALVDSDAVFDAFHDIRKKHNLHIDHAGNLAQIINALILEAVPFTELDTLLKEGMPGVDDETRRKVVQDVNDLIFVPLREKVRKEAEAKLTVVRPTPPAHKPSIRDIELHAAKDVVLPPPAVPHVEMPPEPIPPPGPSIIETKLAQPKAPQVDAPRPAPQPRYHGTDPYRESAE